MADLATRLRRVDEAPELIYEDKACYHVCSEAADEIERLRDGIRDIRGKVTRSLDPAIWYACTSILGDRQEIADMEADT